MKLHLLAFAAHPDDAELSCMGTLLKHMEAGQQVGNVDLTQGELGTRGTPEIRAAEAAEATRIAGLTVRDNLGLADGFFRGDRDSLLKIVAAIRTYQPDVVLANAIQDRHPDHGRGAQVVAEACFLSGLKQIKTTGPAGAEQPAWRPRQVYHYIQDRYIAPDFVVDITAQWEKKQATIRAFRSQFFDPNSSEPDTYISSPEFMQFLEARAQEMGHAIGAKYGEGFTKTRQLGVNLLTDLI